MILDKSFKIHVEHPHFHFQMLIIGRMERVSICPEKSTYNCMYYSENKDNKQPPKIRQVHGKGEKF